MTSLEAAASYIDGGLYPIPVPTRSKHPLIEDWPNLRLTKPDLSRYFNGAPSNIGVILGDERGTADVDLDCVEAIGAAFELLPKTGMVFGRKSKPRSHYFYRSNPPVPSKRYVDPVEPGQEKACLVELRCQKANGGVGLQTVVPPSLHQETGEQIRFEPTGAGGPANVDAPVLQKAVARVAGAVLLARHWPGEKSGRNEAFIALAGVLVRGGWPLDDAIRFHRALYRALWGAQADLEACRAEVAATYEKHKGGFETTGRPKLETLVDKKAVQVAFTWMDISQPGELHPARAEAAGEWPKPELLQGSLPPVKPFHADLLPDSLRPLAEDTAERMQVPLDFPGAVSVICLAGATNRRVAIQPKAYDTEWKVTPSLWGLLIAKPGFLKSPTIEAILRPLSRIQAEWHQEFADAEKKYLIEKEKAKLAHQAWAEEYKAAIKGKKGEPPPPPDEPAPSAQRRLIMNNATLEALHLAMSQNPSGLLMKRDEIAGLLSRLDQDQFGEERAFYLESWGGGSSEYEVARISRGAINAVPCLSILGGIQPSRLRSYLADAIKGGAGDDGLIQRFQMTVWPDFPQDYNEVDRAPNAAALRDAEQMYRRLVALDCENPLRFQFATDAQELFYAWRTKLEMWVRRGDEHPALISHVSKYRSLMPSLASLLEVADMATRGSIGFGGSVMHLSLKNAQRAAAWCDTYLLSHARRVYSCIVSPQAAAAHELAQHIKRKKVVNETGGPDWFSLRDVYRHGWSGLDEPEKAKAALRILEDAHWVREVQTKPSAQGGRTPSLYQVNPGVWQ
jgi:putative DNA primase/helicase